MSLQTAKTEKICRRSEISAYIDGELAPREELELELHFAECRDCLAELNLQKQMLCALDFGLDDKPEIELPENFAKIVATRAETGVSGLRSKEERFRALFLCSLLLLIVLVGLGADTGKFLASSGKFVEQVVAIIGFTGHLVFSLSIGAIIILRSLSGQLAFSSVMSVAIGACLFMVLAILLSRLISRFNRS